MLGSEMGATYGLDKRHIGDEYCSLLLIPVGNSKGLEGVDTG